MRIVILGGTGSIGTLVTQRLVSDGHHVTGVVRNETSERRLKHLGAHPHRGDIRTASSWSRLLDRADAVVHLAATFDDRMAEADRSVAEAICAHTSQQDRRLRVLYTGGCWLYGETGDRVATERTPLRPIAPFAFMARHAAQLQAAANLSVATVHPALAYHKAPNHAQGAFHRFVKDAQTTNPIEVWGSVKTRWPLVEADDLAAAYVALVTRPDLTGAFNVAAQQGVPVQNILRHISESFDHDGSFLIRDAAYVLRNFGPMGQGPMLDQQMDAQKITAATGWQPKLRDFRDAFNLHQLA
ncbi:NAD-dependent epimerase/dehydratase family protein [Epibacterium ulvae]|uniref:NAD-dependent epimerase/dehydratase family protein n=1 Tax=Epibacterium ulvae TaxID=1156985 RepID=UPI001BFC0E2F|nr:NAD-dependent epimerase/dehydratase family protein [Epibacterium ulvae]MBT8152941.1 NAD-dependent epimerase/dehydratase family protein [Epibacterium ulvae]